jgi:hypothetical protein
MRDYCFIDGEFQSQMDRQELIMDIRNHLTDIWMTRDDVVIEWLTERGEIESEFMTFKTEEICEALRRWYKIDPLSRYREEDQDGDTPLMDAFISENLDEMKGEFDGTYGASGESACYGHTWQMVSADEGLTPDAAMLLIQMVK